MSDIDLSRVHLIGIGGAGMSGVARILLSRGKVVSGSDVKESRPVLALQSMGAHVAVGHKAENLTLSGQLPTVVVTSFAAIPQDNPELVAAREHNIPVIRRSDLLGELMTGSTQVLIAGTHGKTSTTSMAVVAMHAAGMDPSFAIGGQLNKAGTNAHQGSGHCFVAEADESDASLLRYSPDIAVVTNIEPDHLDFFHTPEAYFQVFDDFAARLTDTAVLVVCLDDEHAAALGERQKTKVTVRGYGSAAAAERHPDIAYTVVESVAVADQISHAHMRVGEREVEVAMQIPGTHMVLNAAAALTAGAVAGGDYRGVEVYDDYAHHPTEVRAVLTAAREKLAARGSGQVIVVFQPHMYSRTQEFAAEFAEALSLADAAVVLDIYGAREQPHDGITSQLIIDRMTNKVVHQPNFSLVPQTVAELAHPGDMVITMGAGDVTVLADEILFQLRTDD